QEVGQGAPCLPNAFASSQARQPFIRCRPERDEQVLSAVRVDKERHAWNVTLGEASRWIPQRIGTLPGETPWRDVHSDCHPSASHVAQQGVLDETSKHLTSISCANVIAAVFGG